MESPVIFLGALYRNELEKCNLWTLLVEKEEQYLHLSKVNGMEYIGKSLPEGISCEEIINYEKNILSLLNKLDSQYNFTSNDLNIISY